MRAIGLLLVVMVFSGCTLHALRGAPGPLNIVTTSFELAPDAYHPQWTLRVENRGGTMLENVSITRGTLDIYKGAAFHVNGNRYIRNDSDDIQIPGSEILVADPASMAPLADENKSIRTPGNLINPLQELGPGENVTVAYRLAYSGTTSVNAEDFYSASLSASYDVGSSHWADDFFLPCFTKTQAKIDLDSPGSYQCGIVEPMTDNSPDWTPYHAS